MNSKIIHECTIGALEGRVSFPETVKKLIDINIERYHADLVRLEKVFYANNGETYIERLSFADCPCLTEQFDAETINAAIRSIQHNEIDYPEFLRRIIAGGCASYVVWIDGQFASYFGRKGECHIEKFPSQK
ncbi:DUF1398 family protein [Fluoribacter gormanii]|uniref:Phage envelope protein n=1 Tax=Fluoribacter gormanii TaxID=464 RepID=A0A377GJY4_9GAMM|nr:DUF1398 family protein [Fluoribacter gormanii]KTD03233.1 hypothetical protein Lgor_1218 [Fluoribacter gormanii]MCW8443320.1 DUF1398 family protein [Fluoribacter gormanii]MCW8471748.1 DUF1398 family protein [Fluoribacter gormanii]SIR87038.1 Protein of unknown function [Fluoribacter gormanii]STO25140.1 Phage envelope protein [Fluoribacter gormanii]